PTESRGAGPCAPPCAGRGSPSRPRVPPRASARETAADRARRAEPSLPTGSRAGGPGARSAPRGWPLPCCLARQRRSVECVFKRAAASTDIPPERKTCRGMDRPATTTFKEDFSRCQSQSTRTCARSPLLSEISRISNTTTFNGVQLLSAGTTVAVQVGLDGTSNSQISFNSVDGSLSGILQGQTAIAASTQGAAQSALGVLTSAIANV